jgi:hypothetical protein
MVGNRAWEVWNIVLEHCFTTPFVPLHTRMRIVNGISSDQPRQTPV